MKTEATARTVRPVNSICVIRLAKSRPHTKYTGMNDLSVFRCDNGAKICK